MSIKITLSPRCTVHIICQTLLFQYLRVILCANFVAITTRKMANCFFGSFFSPERFVFKFNFCRYINSVTGVSIFKSDPILTVIICICENVLLYIRARRANHLPVRNFPHVLPIVFFLIFPRQFFIWFDS